MANTKPKRAIISLFASHHLPDRWPSTTRHDGMDLETACSKSNMETPALQLTGNGPAVRRQTPGLSSNPSLHPAYPLALTKQLVGFGFDHSNEPNWQCPTKPRARLNEADLNIVVACSVWNCAISRCCVLTSTPIGRALVVSYHAKELCAWPTLCAEWLLACAGRAKLRGKKQPKRYRSVVGWQRTRFPVSYLFSGDK